MNHYVKIIILLFILIPNFTYGFEYKTFSNKNDVMANGLDITVKYPEFYKSLEGNRPHIVRKFNFKDGNILNSMMILVKNINNNEYKEINNYSNEELVDIVEMSFKDNNFSIKNSYSTKIEGERAIILEGYSEIERLNKIVYGLLISSTIFYDSKMINLQCSSSTVISNNRDINEIDKYWNNNGKNACLEYINSIIIMNKYKD